MMNYKKCLSKYMYIENDGKLFRFIIKKSNHYSIIIVNYIYLSAIKRNYLSIIVKRSFVFLMCLSDLRCYAIAALDPPSSSR